MLCCWGRRSLPNLVDGYFLQKKFLGKIQQLGKLFLIEIGIITDVIACVHMCMYISTPSKIVKLGQVFVCHTLFLSSVFFQIRVGVPLLPINLWDCIKKIHCFDYLLFFVVMAALLKQEGCCCCFLSVYVLFTLYYCTTLHSLHQVYFMC